MESTNKTVGYLLIFIGIALILYPVFSVYQVFTGLAKPVGLFEFAPVAIDLSQVIEGIPASASLKQEVVSSELLNTPLNMIFHLVLMGFISGAGLKIATIGTLLARTIKVNIKEEKSVLFPPR